MRVSPMTCSPRRSPGARSRSTVSPRRLGRSRSRLPSWAFGNSGTRFASSPSPACPRTSSRSYEGRGARCTAIPASAPSVALHIPWDVVDGLRRNVARERPRRSGSGSAPSTRTLSGTVLQSSAASVTRRRTVRRKAIDQLLECVAIAARPARGDSRSGSPTGRTTLARTRSRRGANGSSPRCGRSMTALPEPLELLVEYKTLRAGLLRDRPCRLGLGADVSARSSGPEARVLVDLGASRPGREHRADRRRSSSGWGGSVASTSTIASTATTT